MHNLTLDHPLRYPFGVRQRCFTVEGESICDLRAALLPGEVPDFLEKVAGDLRFPNRPVAFLTCGSNASIDRLREKLRNCPVPKGIAACVILSDWIPVYSATLSYYGSIPATFEYIPGESALPFLIVTDQSNVDAIVKSEGKTGNYRTCSVPSSSLGIDVPYSTRAFVSRFGALMLDGAYCRLAEFQQSPSNGMSQEQVVQKTLARIAPDLGVDQYLELIGKPEKLSGLRSKLIASFQRIPHVPGWQELRGD